MRRYLTFLFYLFWSLIGYGQSVPQLQEIADQHFDEAQYTEAIKFYRKIVRLDKSNEQSKFRLAVSYYRTLQYDEAKSAFIKLIEDSADEFRHPSIYYYGTILKLDSDFARADSVFTSLMALADVDDELLESSRKQSEGCIIALNQEIRDRGFVINELEELNSRFHDFGATVNRQEGSVVFVTTRNLGHKQFEGVQYDGLLPDLQQYVPRNNNWRNVTGRKRFDNLNTVWAEGSGSFTGDGKAFYFTTCNFNNGADCKIVVTRLVNDRWNEPEPLNEYINPDSTQNRHPSITQSGDTLFFVSNREGGYGGDDIWMSVRGQEEDSWTPAINMGDVINTVSNEITPYYSTAYNCLLFSSDGHVGYGGYDIFAAKGQSFFEPEIYNLGDPFNSPLNDTYFSISDSVGFMASNRGDHTHLNLYTFDVSDEQLYLSLLISGESLIDQRIVSRFRQVRSLDLTTFRVEDYQGFGLFDPVKREKPKPSLLADDSLEASDVAVIAQAGQAEQSAEQQRQQYFSQYLNNNQLASSLERPIQVGDIVSEAVLTYFEKSDFEKVYFDFSSKQLSKQAKLSLDHLINQLKSHIDYVEYIQVVANTDDVGSNESNYKLSADRGNAVRDYLVSKGYPSTKILTTARGEEELVTKGTSWYERFFDRRAEIYIYSTRPLTFDKSRKLLVRKDMGVGDASQILNISPTKIKLWNEMASDSLKSGDMIRIDQPVYASNVRYFLDETDVKNKFFAYIVGAGETIAAVARKFRTPEELLVEINQLEGEVSEGDVVFVYNRRN